MLLGVIGDTHLGSTDYSTKRRADFSTAFTKAVSLCRENGAEVICLLGDVFDSAATRRNVDAFAEILKEISPTLIQLKKERVPLIAIPGNHEFGRGREAGELSALESLGFMQVLRGTEFNTGDISICGVPWQQDPGEVPRIAEALRKTSRAQCKILLLHNFIKGARSIPPQLWEVDGSIGEGFAKAFVGHHHVYEHTGNCVMPGSTEVQNMLDQSEKFVVVYDSKTGRVDRFALTKTRHVIVLEYDASPIASQELLLAIARDLEKQKACAGAFVYIRIFGTLKAKHGLSKAEILPLLRERELFDYFIDLRYSTQAKTAAETRRGASIMQFLHRAFKGRRLAKAKHYLEHTEGEELFEAIRERILSSDHH